MRHQLTRWSAEWPQVGNVAKSPLFRCFGGDARYCHRKIGGTQKPQNRIGSGRGALTEVEIGRRESLASGDSKWLGEALSRESSGQVSLHWLGSADWPFRLSRQIFISPRRSQPRHPPII